MAAARTQGQGFHVRNGSQIEIAIKVWKKRTAAGRFPLQRVAELCAVDADQQQVALACEMLAGGFDDLGSARKMNEAIAEIDFRAAKHSNTLSRPPQ